jgi:putative Ca2+/H+ antiporter (TMEM165/GDT1 family)
MDDQRTECSVKRPRITATAAAELMMKECGYIVVRIAPPLFPEAGMGLSHFAGQTIPGKQILVEGRTDRRDWDQQNRLVFGKGFVDPNRKTRGTRFYRCHLVPEGPEEDL